MRLLLTGDTHGDNVHRFSYKYHPNLRKLTEEDALIMLGDTAFGWPGFEKENKYNLDYMATKPWTFICIRGNHDVTPVWRNSKPINKYRNIKCLDGTLSQLVYNECLYKNILLVSDTALLQIGEYTALCFGGSDSHDADNLAYPFEKEKIKFFKKSHQHFRIVNKTWWVDERLNIPYAESLLSYHGLRPTYLNYVKEPKDKKIKVDFIFTHDCPARLLYLYSFSDIGRLKPTEGELFLDNVANHVDFKWFVHGHMHIDHRYDNRFLCLYKNILEIPSNDVLEETYNWNIV